MKSRIKLILETNTWLQKKPKKKGKGCRDIVRACIIAWSLDSKDFQEFRREDYFLPNSMRVVNINLIWDWRQRMGK